MIPGQIANRSKKVLYKINKDSNILNKFLKLLSYSEKLDFEIEINIREIKNIIIKIAKKYF